MTGSFAVYIKGIYISLSYLQICLHEYNYEVEKVLNALLEENLLPSLQHLARDLPRYVQACCSKSEN